MSEDELLEALRETFDDRRLSRGERQAWQALLEDAGRDRAMLDRIRGQAFRLVRGTLGSAQAAEALAWLEDVMRVLGAAAAPEERGQPDAACWFSPGEAPLRCIVQELRAVRRQVDICVFTITDDRISDGILGAARRGVGVRLISDDGKAGDLGSDMSRFSEAGIPLALDATPAHMHHKFAIFDRRRLCTGSFNWTRAATGENHENLLVTEDPRLVQPYQEEFERLWVELATGPAGS